jgi:hypothetical protein
LEGYHETLTQRVRLIPAEHDMANPYVVSTLFDLRDLPREDVPKNLPERMARLESVAADPTMLENLKALQDAGVTIAVGTDAGNIGTLHGPSIFREFELMAKAGLSPMEILTAATINGARVLGRTDDLGTVEAGKLADLVILNSNPLTDIGNTSAIYAVVKNGAVYDPHRIIEKTPVDVVQQQVNAYNARDLDAFVATYSDDIEIYNHPNRLILSGREELAVVYRSRFDTAPKLHAKIVDRITLGRFVIDRENVTGLPGGKVINALAIYEVQNRAIRRVWFIRE